MSANPPYGSNNQDPFDDEFQEDPFIDDHFSKKQQGSQGNTASASIGIAQLPDSNTVLVLGIISIVGAFCYGIVGMIVGIIALAMVGRPERAYRAAPGNYSISSYNNLKAGKVCAIIGVSISAVYLVVIAGIFFFVIANEY